jgi:hypothetical protein
MLLIVADNDSIGAVAALRQLVLVEFLVLASAEFTDLAALGRSPAAPDRDVWLACQNAGALLLTGDRQGGADSLDEAIRQLSDETSLPVITLADARRVLSDRNHAEEAALRLLDSIGRIDTLRGTGRLFIP